MILAAYRQTMAGVTTVEEEPPRATPRRDRLIDLSQRWIAQSYEARWGEIVDTDRRLWEAQVRNSIIPILEHAPAMALIKRVAWWHGLKVQALIGSSRCSSRISEARHDAVHAVWKNCRRNGRQLSLTAIAAHFGRDRTTIMSSLGLRQRS